MWIITVTHLSSVLKMETGSPWEMFPSKKKKGKKVLLLKISKLLIFV